jgi:hypothetical protein
LRIVPTVTVLLGLSAAAAVAADQTWIGTISDSMCRASHDSASEHDGKQMSNRDCTLACVKENSAKYVFISHGTVFNIANQDAPGLEENAGGTVDVTGDLSGDTITVSKIEMAGHSK